MKYKLKRIHNAFFFGDDKIASMFQKEAQKGWMLKSIGSLFFRFEKCEPQDLSFFLDYQRPDQEYRKDMENYGYHYIDNYRTVSVYYSEENEPMHSDETVMYITKKEMFKTSHIVLNLLAAFIIYTFMNIISFPSYFFRTFDHIILYFNGFLTYIMTTLLVIEFVLSATMIILLKYHYRKLIAGNKGIEKVIKVGSCLSYVAELSLSFIIILILISTGLIINGMFLLSVAAFMIIFYVFSFMMNKQIIKIKEDSKRYVSMILCLLLFVFVHYQTSEFFSDDEIKPSNTDSYQSDILNYKEHSRTLFYKEITYYGTGKEKDEFDDYITTYYESIYDCLNKDIAKSVFKALVINADHEKRIPDDETIDEIVDQTGSFDTLKDVPFYSYEESLNDLDQYDIKGCDLACGYDQYYYLLDGNKVYEFMVKEDTDIQILFDYYQ